MGRKRNMTWRLTEENVQEHRRVAYSHMNHNRLKECTIMLCEVIYNLGNYDLLYLIRDRITELIRASKPGSKYVG